MSKRSHILVLALLMLAAGAAVAADTAADEAAVRALNPSWFKAYNAGDIAGVAALYADDAVLCIPGAPAARGKAAIREALDKDRAVCRGEGEDSGGSVVRGS